MEKQKQHINILHLLSWAPTPENPTLGNFCFRHISALPSHCHSVILTVTAGTCFELKQTKESHYTHIQVTFVDSDNAILRKWRRWQGYQKGLNYVRWHLFEPDIVHVHVTYPAGSVALYWKLRYSLPYVITEHWTGYQPQNRSLISPCRLWFMRHIARHAGTIMPVSQDLADNMRRCGMKAHYHVVYNVTDTDCFTLKAPVETCRKQLLHISTLRDEAKNFSGILRVIERLKQQRTDFLLNVVHDYEAPQFVDYVQQHELTDLVVFHGKKNTPEIAEMYRHSDFLLLFSNYENLPCVIVEAFACGVPVLATRVGGIAEIVNNERGLLVEAGDEDALLDKINFMLDHAREYDAAAIRGYATQQFSPEVIGQQMAEVYRQIGRQAY